jgi:hypothetical protein
VAPEGFALAKFLTIEAALFVGLIAVALIMLPAVKRLKPRA